MTIDATIDATIPDLERKLSALARSQVPFATALALTMTAVDARDQVREELPRRFTIRRPWVSRGIRTSRATKRRPEAAVWSRDEFMIAQETGATRRPRGRSIALPRGIRRNVRQVVPRSRRPRRILENPRTFIAPLRGGDRGIFRRRGRKGRAPELLYRLESGAVRIRPRWEFEETVDQVVARRFERNFGRALARAIATSR